MSWFEIEDPLAFDSLSVLRKWNNFPSLVLDDGIVLVLDCGFPLF